MNIIYYYRLDVIDPQLCLLLIKHNGVSIYVDYSLIKQFQDYIGKVYEIYGTVEKRERDGQTYCSALFLNIVEDADMSLLEQSFLVFNKIIYPQFIDIFS